MGKWKKANRRWHHIGQHESVLAKLSVIFLLSNGFIWAGLRGLDILVLSLIASFSAGTGLLLSLSAKKALRQKHGRLGGEAFAIVGYWGNLITVILSFMLFSYSLFRAILRGELF